MHFPLAELRSTWATFVFRLHPQQPITAHHRPRYWNLFFFYFFSYVQAAVGPPAPISGSPARSCKACLTLAMTSQPALR